MRNKAPKWLDVFIYDRMVAIAANGDMKAFCPLCHKKRILKEQLGHYICSKCHFVVISRQKRRIKL